MVKRCDGLGLAMPGSKGEKRPMKTERLEELQQNINELKSLNLEECAALIGEVWRLKSALAAKDIEVSYWRDAHDQVRTDRDRLIEADRLLQAENDLLSSVHGLPSCELENRWSNCAVRRRKSGTI
jgi:hypothetical protein